MNESQAKRLIRETFEHPFDETRFKKFISNLLKHADFSASLTYKGQFMSEAFRPYIASMHRIAKYSDGKNKIDILVVKMKKGGSLVRARSMQRNFIAWFLNSSRKGIQKDAALVAFVSPQSSDWRFSLVKMDYVFDKDQKKVKTDFTPARRWSFLVGEHENSHTAQSRFVGLLQDDTHDPDLDKLEKAFDIEVVTREFFKKYRDLFIRIKKALDGIVQDNYWLQAEFKEKRIDTVNFAKKLLGQLIFLYFLQKKGWLGVPRRARWGNGPRTFLRDLFNKKYVDYNNFFNDMLEPLFYEALSKDRSHEDGYYSQFDCRIPFLNGGLFDPINDYDWVGLEITLPDSLFSNNNKTPEGDTGNGILDVFDRYNFTVYEAEPLEKEVAIDPELLGKAYEKFNAIRADNFDEYVDAVRTGREMKFNKRFGVYYTPRRIVHYMAKQSLAAWLSGETGIERPIMESLVFQAEQLKEHELTALEKEAAIQQGLQRGTKYTRKLDPAIEKNAALIDEKLASIRVCDPAVGSGAFPLGMLHEIVDLRLALSHIFPEKLPESGRTAYDFKRHAIKHSLYGVDIDPGAVEIAKLRLWLSLVVDEQDFHSIKPLPNLGYNIMQGDSLLGVDISDMFERSYLEQIEVLKDQYRDQTNINKKLALDNNIQGLMNRLTHGRPAFDFRLYFSEVFQEKEGFDIVLANPPYIQLQKAFDSKRKYADLYKDRGYETFERTGDIYALFYEKGVNILKPDGIICYITSNKWMRAAYGKSLRGFFSERNPLMLLDMGPNVFETATVDTSILLLQRTEPAPEGMQAMTVKKLDMLDGLDNSDFVRLNSPDRESWVILNPMEQRIKEKIEKAGIPLKFWDVNIYRGVLTGYNKAFIIDGKTKNALIATDPKSAEVIKPILRGRDIKRYKAVFADLWLIATFPALKIDIDDYPAIKAYLEQFLPKIKQTGEIFIDENGNEQKTRKKTGNKWFETQDSIDYWKEFEKEKVVYNDISQQLAFSLCETGTYFNNTVYFITGSIFNKYFVAVLNSKLMDWYYKKISVQLGKKAVRLFSIYVEKIPIPKLSESEQQPFVDLVDRIMEQKAAGRDTTDLERQIDLMVYELYGLTPEDIRVIEPESEK